MNLRITNAYIHDCRIANSAGREIHKNMIWNVTYRRSKFLNATTNEYPLFAGLMRTFAFISKILNYPLIKHCGVDSANGRRAPRPAEFANSAAESISICNAEKTADVFVISGMTKLRITNDYIHDCRIANSAGRNRAATVAISPPPRSAQAPACVAPSPVFANRR
jgi:hypothetical protein